MDTLAPRDPVRVTLGVSFVAGLIVTSFWVLQPFLPAALWAVTIVIATWPLMLRVESMLWGRRGLAVAVMTLLMLLGFIVPLTLALLTIVTHAHDIVDWVESLATLLLVVLFAAILYASGETAAGAARRFARRLAGARGEHSARLAAQAIVVTALMQAVLAAAGLFVVGVPFPGMLTALVFLLCVAQIGAGPVMFLAVFWTYWSGASGWGTALLVWSLFVLSLDNVVRPILIRKGADLPLLLVFVSVAGGLLAFGVVGIFVGPAVLAVAYSLLADWINTRESGDGLGRRSDFPVAADLR